MGLSLEIGISLRAFKRIAPCRPGAAATVDSQGKEELDVVRDCLAGRVSEANVPKAADKATRHLILAELLAAMSAGEQAATSTHSEAVSSDDAEAVASAQLRSVGEQQQQNEQKERARKLFMDHGYFEGAVQDLRDAISPQQRAEAARTLGVVSSQRSTPHLIAAMFDDDPEVRNAAEEALSKMASPAANVLVDDAAIDERHLVGSQTSEKSPFSEQVAGEAMASQELEVHGRQESLLGESAREDQAISQPSPTDRHRGEAVVNTESSSSFSGIDESNPTQETAPQDNQKMASIDEVKVPSEPDQLLKHEQDLRESANQLERQVADALSARTELEKEVILSIERETTFRSEAANRRLEDDERRKRADEEAERRRANEHEALRAEQLTRVQAETEANRLAEEEARKRLESINLRKAAEELVWQRIEIENARREAAEAARREAARNSREEAERQHHAELTRLRNEEEALRAATAEAATRKADLQKANQDTKAELERLTKERVQVAAAEAVRHAEATRLRREAKTRHEAEVSRLRSEEEALRAVAEQVSRQRAEVAATQQKAESEIARLTKERAQLAEAEAARRAESESTREAEEKNRADHERLRHELEGLRLVEQEVANRQAELEVSRKKAQDDATRLQATQARIQVEQETNDRLEAERLRIEADLREQVKTQRQLIEEARERVQREHQRMELEARGQVEHEEKLRAELALLRQNAEMTAAQRVEEERQVRNQVDSLRIADAEARKRIEEAEARRRKSEDVYRLVAEKVQRVEAEAHMRANEEQQMLAKLEAVRRTAAIEAQARAEQERRIKEEIEYFRKLEEVERPRLEVAALQRTQAQGLFQQQREQFQSEEHPASETQRGPFDAQHLANARPEIPNLQGQDMSAEAQSTGENRESSRLRDVDREAEAIGVEGEGPTGVAATIQTYLSSVDPYKRAAAVAELVPSGAKDAFDLIVKCFDDSSSHVRNAAARALRKLEPSQTVDLFNRALEEASEERRRNIGAAIAASGMAAEAIDNLVGDNREETYNALLILFVMAKAGEVRPLVKAIEDHENVEVCRAVIKLSRIQI